jgi:hypothetical protein
MTHPLCRLILRVAPLALLCLFLAGGLAGCLAVNAVLGVIGLVASGPIQYAGTAYTVGEYTYEYAVNDKTPDVVLGEKIAWLTRDDAQPETATVLAQDQGLMGSAELTLRSAREQTSTPAMPMTTGSLASPTAREYAKLHFSSDESSYQMASLSPTDSDYDSSTSRRPAVSEPPIVVAAVQSVFTSQSVRPAVLPVHPSTTPSEAPVRLAPPIPNASATLRIAADPLLARMDRMESALAQAEEMLLRGPDQGVRYQASAPEAEADQDEAGVSGAWSIRHPVMQHGPEA